MKWWCSLAIIGAVLFTGSVLVGLVIGGLIFLFHLTVPVRVLTEYCEKRDERSHPLGLR